MSLVDLVSPKNCLGCGKGGGYICESCIAKERLMKPACPYCEKASIDGFTHAKCRKKYGLDGLTSIWRYQGIVKRAILSLKYKYATEITSELVNLMALESKKLYIPQNFILVPIPIYWHRQNVRGFNQSEVVGRLLASKLGLSFNNQTISRALPTTPQAMLSVAERKLNLKHVFRVESDVIKSNILLFDDVFTTGSTLHEAAKTLKKSGAWKVWGLTIAR